MPQTYQKNAWRFLSILITVGMLVASLQLFFRSRIERLQNQRTEKTMARREADLRHDLALERLQNQLQSYDQWATAFTAFVRSSVNVRTDEFRTYLAQSGAFTQDPALRGIVLAGGVDPAQYGGTAKGFAFHADLNQLTALPNGAVFADTDETSLFVRSIALPEDLIPRLERGRGRNLRLVMLVDVEALFAVFAETLPGLLQLTVRMGSVEQPDRDHWSSQQFQFAKGRGGTSFDHDLSAGGLMWEMEWTEQLEKKSANANAPTHAELIGLGLSIASLLILLRLSWVPRRSNATNTQIQQAILQTPVPAFRVDTHGFVTDMNQQALTHIRKNREEIVGLVRLRDLSSGPFVPVTGAALGLQPGEMIAFGPLHQYEQQQASPNPLNAAAPVALPPISPRPPVASAPREFALDSEATQVSQPRAKAATEVTEVAPAMVQPIAQPIAIARREPMPEKPKAARMQENPFRRTVAPEPYNVVDSFDLAVFKNLTGADVEVMEEARKLSLQSLPQQFQALCEIVTAGDAKRIQIAAHTMKSNLALLGSKGAMEICLKIEQDELDDTPLMIWLDRLEPMLVKILKELKEADFGAGKKPVTDNPFKRREA